MIDAQQMSPFEVWAPRMRYFAMRKNALFHVDCPAGSGEEVGLRAFDERCPGCNEPVPEWAQTLARLWECEQKPSKK